MADVRPPSVRGLSRAVSVEVGLWSDKGAKSSIARRNCRAAFPDMLYSADGAGTYRVTVPMSSQIHPSVVRHGLRCSRQPFWFYSSADSIPPLGGFGHSSVHRRWVCLVDTSAALGVSASRQAARAPWVARVMTRLRERSLSFYGSVLRAFVTAGSEVDMSDLRCFVQTGYT